MTDAERAKLVIKLQKAMLRAMRKYGANSVEFDRARNKYFSTLEGK